MCAKCVRKTRSGNRAFTLLEILIVVGILALLAAFAVPSLIGSSEQAKRDMALAAVRPAGTIGQVLDKFYFDVGQYPESLEDLMKQPSYVEEDDDGENPWRGPYLKDIGGLKDPWRNEYQYKAPGDVNEDGYDLWSMGRDGKDGTDDDVTPWPKNR